MTSQADSVLSPSTREFEAEIEIWAVDTGRKDFFESKDRMLSRAQARAAIEVFRRGPAFGRKRAYLARLDRIETQLHAAREAKDDVARHKLEVKGALFANAMQFHVTRWLTWWAVTAGIAGTVAAFMAVLLTALQLLRDPKLVP